MDCIGKGLKEIELETGGVQGRVNLKRSLRKEYHEYQEKLFMKEGVTAHYDTSGSKLKRKSDGHELTIEEFCQVINDLILRWNLKCTESSVTQSSGTNIDLSFTDDLKSLQLAVPVVIKRYQMQYLRENNLCD